jgi:hypothetical protein
MKSNTELKKIAANAFEAEYGVRPELKKITLLESSGDGSYVMFAIGKREYSFNNGQFTDWHYDAIINEVILNHSQLYFNVCKENDELRERVENMEKGINNLIDQLAAHH